MAWDDFGGRNNGGNDFDTRLGRQSGPFEMMSNMSDLGRIQRLMKMMGEPSNPGFQDFGRPERMASLVGSLEEEPYQDFGSPKFGQQDFTQPVPIAGAQNVGVQRGNPLQTLLSSIQRRRQGQQGQQGILQRGFTGRV